MPLIRVTREPGNHSPRILLPIGSVETGKSGDEINAAVVVDRACKRFHVRAFLNESEIVAKPLHQRSRDGDSTFESVMNGPAAKLVGNRSQQPEVRRDEPLAGIHQQKAARPVGILHLAGPKTRLPDQSCLLVAKNPANGNPGNRRK